MVGLNVPSDLLEQAIGFTSTEHLAQFRQDWLGRSFYSLDWKAPPTPSSSEFRRSSDVINTPGALVGRIQRVVLDGRQPVRK